MDPATIYALSMIGSSLIGGLMGGGEAQERNTFRSTGQDSDPVSILQDLVGSSKQLGGALGKRAAEPAPFRSSYVPDVPGLPKDLGASDSSLLNIPGVEGLNGLFGLNDPLAPGYSGKTRRRQPWEYPTPPRVEQF
jgi:hypothetical protein